MKILLTHRFFWPDTAPYATMLRVMGDALAEAGHDVHILSSMPSYRSNAGAIDALRREKLGALDVRRIWILRNEKIYPIYRIINVILYCWAIVFAILRLRPDVVMASTFPPVVAAWCASSTTRLIRSHFIYHTQDIYPEILQFSGGCIGPQIFFHFLRWLDNQTLRRAKSIVTLSEDMADTLRARGSLRRPIKVINNPALNLAGEKIAPPDELLKSEDTVRVIFAGNIGRFQNLQLLAEGVSLCFDAHPELELMFLGDGVALPGLKARWAAHPQVRFAPFLPFAQARGLIAEADVGLVSLSPNIYKVAYPSKIATYRNLGLSILALVEPESHLARDIERSGHGVVPAAATPWAIAVALERILAGRDATSDVQDCCWSSARWVAMIDAVRSDHQ